MITDGWLNSASRAPGPPWKTNTSMNEVTGIVVHSAEGNEMSMLKVLHGPNAVSWHMSVYKDGRTRQHYPLFAICWHATAMNPFTIGVECEGKAGEPLTDAQIASVKRIIKDVSEWKGWVPRRPYTSTDLDASLWEHNETVRFGGSPTACPSGRIAWDKILEVDVEELTPEHKRLIEDREGRVMVDALLTHHYNTRRAFAAGSQMTVVGVEFYDPETGESIATLPVPSLP